MIASRWPYGTEALTVLAIMTVSACSGENSGTSLESGPEETIEDPVPPADLRYETIPPSLSDSGINCISSAHDCGIVRHPAWKYPELEEPGEATCDTSFLIGEDGFAQDINVECDDPRFNDATLKGLSEVQYQVTDKCGRVCSRIGTRVEYPIEYRLDE